MFQPALVLAVMTPFLLAAISLADETCKYGATNQNLCQKTCNSTHCACTMDGSSTFKSCTQKCNFLSSCRDMVCSGGNTCSQQCFFGSCNMKCLSSMFCYQSCVWKAKCQQVTCSSSTCSQVCANCTMVCPRGVESCHQMCLGGECDMRCFARKCIRQCLGGKCNSIGHTEESNASPVQPSFWIWILLIDVFTL